MKTTPLRTEDHGKTTGYRKGCRCEHCSAASNMYHTRRASRNNLYLRRYGITVEEYDRIFEAQGGLCAICGTAPTAEVLCVDHNHVTGQVRGLLCHSCNTGIGYLQADLGSERLENAVRYLSKQSQEFVHLG